MKLVLSWNQSCRETSTVVKQVPSWYWYCHETSTVIKLVLSWNWYCHETSTVMERVLSLNKYCHETSNLMKQVLSWNKYCHETPSHIKFGRIFCRLIFYQIPRDLLHVARTEMQTICINVERDEEHKTGGVWVCGAGMQCACVKVDRRKLQNETPLQL